MTTPRPKWDFVTNDAGMTQGWNDAGVETFRGSQVPSLTREVIQNSIDAVANVDRPVRVRFSLENDVNFGQSELATTFNRCREAMADIESDRTLAFFKQGAPELEFNAQIQTLVIHDFNTTGLAGNRWHMLTKAMGVGVKTAIRFAWVLWNWEKRHVRCFALSDRPIFDAVLNRYLHHPKISR